MVIFGGSPQSLTIEVIEERAEDLLQMFPWKPFVLGRSIGMERIPGSGTMRGYVLLTNREGKSVRQLFHYMDYVCRRGPLAEPLQGIYGLTNNHVVNASPATHTQ